MLRRCSLLSVPIVLLLVSNLAAGTFPQDFQAAVRLSRTDAAQAEAAFLELAARPDRRPQGTDAALERASLCAVARKDFEAAETHAASIKDPALQTLCRMRILKAQHRWNDILDLAGDQDLAAWPERLIYDAAMCRGQARAITGNASAENDFLLARAGTYDSRELAFADLALGNLYRDQLKDTGKALAAYKRVAASPVTGAAKYDSAISYAALSAARGEAKDATAALDALNADTIPSPYWRCRVYEAYGDVYASVTRSVDAASAYRKALTVPDAPEYLVRPIEEKLTATTPPPE